MATPLHLLRSLPVAERAALAVLDAVARRPDLLDQYVLKGGMALMYAYGSPRRSLDIDFTAVGPFTRDVTPEKTVTLLAFRDALNESLAEVAPERGFARLRVHWWETTQELPVLLARVGYAEALPEGSAFERYVEMQVTLSEAVLETQRTAVHGIPLHVATLEDIVAEKLKAFLQQLPRGVRRPNDLFDLWYFTTQANHPLDGDRIARYLPAKAEGWPEIQPVTRGRFHDPALKALSAETYEAARAEGAASVPFPPFEEAYRAVMAFVDGLGLPEG